MYFRLLLMILSTAPCVNCIELNQPALIVIKPGESFSISCKITGYSASGGGCTNWIRHSAGKAMEWIGWFCSSGDTGTSDTMKNKISFTAETSSNTVFLQGQSFQTEDTAVYYCARKRGGDYFDYWGKGTKVTVSSAEESPPKSIFALSQCTADSGGFVTVGCLTRGFSPADSLTFKWTDSTTKELSDVVQYPAFMGNGEYSKISHMSVKKSDLDPKNPYKCKASNSKGSLEAEIRKVPKVPEVPKVPKVPDGKKPSIFIYKPDNIETDHISHVCEVTNPKPGDVPIIWKVGEDSYIQSKTNATIVKENSTSVLSILTITKKKYDDLKTSITCAVKQDGIPDEKSPLQVSTSKKEPPEPVTGFALDCNEDVLEEDEFRSLWSTATSFIFLFLFSLTYSAVLSFFKVKQ